MECPFKVGFCIDDWNSESYMNALKANNYPPKGTDAAWNSAVKDAEGDGNSSIDKADSSDSDPPSGGVAGDG